MATYQEQFRDAFNKHSSTGKTNQQIYDAIKQKLVNNNLATTALDDYYKSLSSQPNVGITGITSSTPASLKTEDYKASNNASYKLTTRPDGKVEFISAQTGKPRIFNSKDEAIATIEAVAKKNPIKSAEQTEMKSTGKTNKASETITSSFLDKDTASHMRNQVNAINSEYDDKIKNQQEYAKNIMDAYNANKDEFDAKYKDMRDNINKMENELNSNYATLKDAISTNYKEGMETYARQAAAAQAGISCKYADSSSFFGYVSTFHQAIAG